MRVVVPSFLCEDVLARSFRPNGARSLVRASWRAKGNRVYVGMGEELLQTATAPHFGCALQALGKFVVQES
jgi:hypothetical protein